MKVKYQNKVHETKIENGLLVSADGKYVFGSPDNLICGEEVVEVIEEPTEEVKK